MIKNFPRIQNKIEGGLVPASFKQCRLAANLHEIPFRKGCRYLCCGFDFKNPYRRMWLVSHQREIQMGLDRDVFMSHLDFQLRQGRQPASCKRLMDTRLEPVPSLKGYLALESFSSIFGGRSIELGSQCRPWAVQHFGDIRHADISGAVPKPICRSLFRIPFQATAENF